MGTTRAAGYPEYRAMTWWGRAAAVVVLVVAGLNFVGWPTGIDGLTRIIASWPQTTPWTALLVAGLGVAVLVQSGHPSRNQVRAGRGLALLVGVLAVGFLLEYVTDRSFGLDQLWFPDAVGTMESWPGRPSPQTALSALLLSVAVGLTRVDRRWTPMAWIVSLVAAAAVPFVIVSGHVLEILALIAVNQSTGLGISTAIAITLLVMATFVARPDRNPLAWLLARPDRMALIRMAGILASLPILLGFSRQVFLAIGLSPGTERVLSLAMGAIAIGAAAFYFFLLGARQNITELREAKQALAARNAELEVVVASAADGIFTINSGGVIESANEAATVLFGYQHAELLGQNVRMLMGEPYRSEHDSYLARYVQTREAHVLGVGREVEARHQDGTIFPIFLTVNEFWQDGRQCFVGNVHDRSEQVRQMAALVRSNRDLEQFAAVASHDLQTPARSIISFVEILREDLPRELLTDETAEFMDHLHSSALKMREQITGLLQISRLKQTRDRYTQVNLTEAVEAATGSLAEQISDSDAHVEVGDLGQAWGDPIQLRLLFENLLSNAIKYRDFSRAPQINIFATDLESANSVHIVFQDNGIGINADQRERVFEIFQRLHPATQTEYQGTGIGLALCRRIVDQHHGRMQVDSVPDGPGSRFHVWLPKTAKSLVMQPSEKGYP